MLSEQVLRSAPDWLVERANSLIKSNVKYVVARSAHQPRIDPSTGFCCWGFVWYYYKLVGIELPLDAYEAEKLCVVVKDRLRWLDVVSYSNFLFSPIPHLGVMESEYKVLHCSGETNGVARSAIVTMPTPTKVYRYAALV